MENLETLIAQVRLRGVEVTADGDRLTIDGEEFELEAAAVEMADILDCAASQFEARRADRIDRYEKRAAAARAEASARFNSQANKTLSGMQGEPVKIGHHSEGRHRRLIERAWNDMGKGVELSAKADHYEQRAAAVEHNGAISSDDPRAIEKLEAKLQGMQAQRERMKAINTAHTKFLRKPESLDAAALTEDEKSVIRNYRPAYSWEPHPHAPFEFQNLGANIRRVEQRIAELKRKPAQVSTDEVKGDGYHYREDLSENRILFYFDQKPPKAVCTIMKQSGFRWSPTRGAWSRQLTGNAQYHARAAAAAIDALSATT